MRSRGAIAFAEMGGKASVVGDRYGFGQATIHAWRAGRRRPDLETRRAIHRDGGPPPEWWDEPAPDEPADAPDDESWQPDPEASPQGVRQLSNALYVRAQRYERELSRVKESFPLQDRVHLLEKLSKVMGQLAKLTGELALTEKQLLANPIVAALLERVCAAIENAIPDAEQAATVLRAVADALESDS